MDEPKELGRSTLLGMDEGEADVSIPLPSPSNRPRNRPELLDRSLTQSATISSVGDLVSGVNLTDKLLLLRLEEWLLPMLLMLLPRRNAGRKRRARRKSDAIETEQLSSSSVNSSSVAGPSVDGDVRADTDGSDDANA